MKHLPSASSRESPKLLAQISFDWQRVSAASLGRKPGFFYARFNRTLMGMARPAISILPLNQVSGTGSVFDFFYRAK
jgi:hypothetical protein